MIPCISEATTMAGTFAEDVAAFSEAGFTAMEVWLTKLETHLQQHAAAETKRLLEDRGLALAAASFQGGLLLSQGEQRRSHYDHFQRRLSMCQELGIPTIIVVADFGERMDRTGLERAQVSLTQAAQLAASFDVRIALEFQGSAAWCSSLDTAVAMVRACNEPNLGVCFDVFHYYTGPSKFEDLQLLNRATLFFVQVSDVGGVPRELATDADRILPGDGDFQLAPIIQHLKDIGYAGGVSVELLNPELWKMKPDQVAGSALAAIRRLIGM